MLVVTTSVVDHLSMKLSLCSKLSLLNKVHFVQTQSETLEAIMNLSSETKNAIGFAMVIIDIEIDINCLEKFVKEIFQLLKYVEAGYTPKIVLFTNQR